MRKAIIEIRNKDSSVIRDIDSILIKGTINCLKVGWRWFLGHGRMNNCY